MTSEVPKPIGITPIVFNKQPVILETLKMSPEKKRGLNPRNKPTF